MKKIARQLTDSVRKPPSTGPIASAIALTPAHVPIAIPRCSAGNAWVMIDSVAGIMNAAPTPWTARNVTSIASLAAKPITRLESPNTIDAEQEHPAAAEDVAEPAAGDHQHRERQRVGVDRPLEPRQRRVQIALDRRQRDVHDSVVEHQHEQREAHRAERPPAAVLVGHQPVAVGEDPVGHGASSGLQSATSDRLSSSSSAVASGLALGVGQTPGELLEATEASGVEPSDHGARAVGDPDALHPPVVGILAPLDEPAADEVIDHPARGGERDVHRLAACLSVSSSSASPR